MRKIATPHSTYLRLYYWPKTHAQCRSQAWHFVKIVMLKTRLSNSRKSMIEATESQSLKITYTKSKCQTKPTILFKENENLSKLFRNIRTNVAWKWTKWQKAFSQHLTNWMPTFRLSDWNERTLKLQTASKINVVCLDIPSFSHRHKTNLILYYLIQE